MGFEGSGPYPYLMFGFVLLAATVFLLVRVLIHTTTGGTVIAASMLLAAFMVATAAYLGVGFMKLSKQRGATRKFAGKERELLSAIRKNGDCITPTEAAIETSLTVREADQMLTELTSAAYLQVESRDGSLYYKLPSKRNERG